MNLSDQELVHILSQIRQNPVSLSDINSPTPTFSHCVIFDMLVQVGFSPTFMSNIPVQYQICSAMDSEAAKQDHLCRIARHFFERVIKGCEFQFSVLDLVQPEAHRLKAFLAALVDFWIFSNNQYASFIEGLNQIKGRGESISTILNNIHEIQQKTNNILASQKAEKIEVEKLNSKINCVDEEVKQICANLQESKLNSIKEMIAEATSVQDTLCKEISALEEREKSLTALFRAEKQEQELQMELEQLNTEYLKKVDQSAQFSKRCKEWEAFEAEVAKNYDILKPIHSKLDSHKKLKAEIVAKADEFNSTKKLASDLDEKLLHLFKALNDIQAEMSTEKKKWALKKQQLEAELKDRMEYKQVVQKKQGEEEIVASELQNRIKLTKRKTDGEKMCLDEEVKAVKEAFHRFMADSKTKLNAFLDATALINANISKFS